MKGEKAGVKQALAYPLRMPGELRQKLQASADVSGRSLNQEIVDRLEGSVGPPPEVPTGLRQIVEAAMTGGGESFEEVAVRLVVLGIQSQSFRQTAEALAAAERYRTVALHQLLIAANEQLSELLRHLNADRSIDAERLAEAMRHRDAIARQISQLGLALPAGPGYSSIGRGTR
ncbi:Arc family DNA-binding protein [Burkholderia sp. D-99]|uniref:Arc family DNA-binding protein n=1 Tax=Burkholderia sp. D-99 TaxID=2717316 RepID=UPI00141D882D|nr:Arc family DNA-binding protein [Burkholderia sp. D-99]NHV25853.1 Arc family DNA-binding protein [Burkholderia sp. D-99]